MDALLTDTISIMKSDGQKLFNLKASVQKEKIFVNDGSVQIEVGDCIEHRLSNGSVDLYDVLDPGFFEPSMSFPAHYQIEVEKRGIIHRSERMLPIQNIISIGTMTGSQIQQATVMSNQGSTASPHSFRTDLSDLLKELRDFKNKIDSSAVQQDFESELETIEAQLKNSNPKVSIIKETLKSIRSIMEGISASVAVEFVKTFMTTHHLF